MRRILSTIAVSLVAVACTGSAHEQIPPAISPYQPSISAGDFVQGVDNRYFPLRATTRYRYSGKTEDGVEKDIVYVTRRTTEVMGVTCMIVKDIVSLDGEIIEKTFDWYAQDRLGNVWYFGEDSTEYENGEPHSKEGSWEAGVDGALPGIIMLAEPHPGDQYRQEYAAGEAEDVGRVVAVGASVDVPSGSFLDVVVTEDSSLIETGLLEHKYYAPGVGVVMEQNVKGPKEQVELIEVRRP